jgi:hypothetical protein
MHGNMNIKNNKKSHGGDGNTVHTYWTGHTLNYKFYSNNKHGPQYAKSYRIMYYESKEVWKMHVTLLFATELRQKWK